MTRDPGSLPPIHRSLTVPWPAEAAFRRFTAELASWWPLATHSVGQTSAETAVFECRLGGRIYERLKDGTEHPWGEVTRWEPPDLVGFRWHPSRPRETAQDVEIRFLPNPAAGGTRVELTSWGWERWGKRARVARRGYRLGWGYVLDVWSGRRTARVRILDAIGALVRGGAPGDRPVAGMIDLVAGGQWLRPSALSPSAAFAREKRSRSLRFQARFDSCCGGNRGDS